MGLPYEDPLIASLPRHCDNMCETLGTIDVDMDTWSELEAQALQIVQSADKLEMHDLHYAVFSSGSGRLMRLAWDKTPATEITRFQENKGIAVSYGVVRNLSINDLAWMRDIGMKHQIRDCCLRDCLTRDSLEYAQFVADMFSITVEEMLYKAISKLPGNLCQQNTLAEPIADALRSKSFEDASAKNPGTADLGDLLTNSLVKKDLRMFAALLSLGVDMNIEDRTLPSYTPDMVRNLLNRTTSNHGRLMLICREPDTVSILKRDKADPFMGLTQDCMG